MNGVGLTTVGRLRGHRQRETTAIYAHLDDGTLRDAAARAATFIARAMGYRAEPPRSEETDYVRVGSKLDRSIAVDRRTMPPDPLDPSKTENRPKRLKRAEPEGGKQGPPEREKFDWLGDDLFDSSSNSAATHGAPGPPPTPGPRLVVKRPHGAEFRFRGHGPDEVHLAALPAVDLIPPAARVHAIRSAAKSLAIRVHSQSPTSAGGSV